MRWMRCEPESGMIELDHVQAQALLRFIQSTKSFVSTVETADRPTAAIRDSLIDDCEQWRGVILRAIDKTPMQPGETTEQFIKKHW
jgi:hypothetical protein